MPKTQLVSADAVEEVRGFVDGVDRVGLDTEFMRERTYFPQLCLVQIATPDAVCCVDPLGAQGLDPFWDCVMERTWVVHSGRQDVEVVYRAAGRLPGALFDTQVAAALLGFQPQIGYAALVAELFGVELAKSHTRADWSRRPLAPELLEYAAEDVLHLLPAADLLSERLAEAGRLEWAAEDSAALLDETLYRPEPAQAIRRLKGARRLSGRAHAAAARLAAWRERQAVDRDRPRQWILGDAPLLELASAAPATAEGLSRISGLAPGTIRRAGSELLAAIAAGADDPADTEPPPRPDERHRTALVEMQARVAACAAELALPPEVVASKKELSAALFGERNLRVFRGWRRGLVGNALLDILDRTTT